MYYKSMDKDEQLDLQIKTKRIWFYQIETTNKCIKLKFKSMSILYIVIYTLMSIPPSDELGLFSKQCVFSAQLFSTNTFGPDTSSLITPELLVWS